MARTVVGYAGEGRSRRAIYRDHGPARGRAGGPDGNALGVLGAQVLPNRFLTGGNATIGEMGGAGQIERRQASDAQRAQWAAERETPAPVIAPKYQLKPEQMARGSRPGTESFQAASRARGAARAGFVQGATKPYLPSPASRETGGSESAERAEVRAPGTTPAEQARRSPSRELPGVIAVARRTQPTTAVTPSPLEEGSMVASVTAPPASNGHVNIPDSIPGNYSRPRSVDVITPCDDCSHAPICRIRPTFQGLTVDATFADVKLDPAIRIVAVSVECEYFLERPAPVAIDPVIKSPLPRQDAREGVTSAVAPDDAATPPPAAARPSAAAVTSRLVKGGKLPADRAERDELVLDAVRTTTNTELAGKKVNVSGARIQQIVREIREAGRMPADVATLLAARGSKPKAVTS